MQAIRSWLATHPRQAPGLMALNGSYVFFRLIDGEGPIGAQKGVPLMPGRSMAVDPSYVPMARRCGSTPPTRSSPRAAASPRRRARYRRGDQGPIRGDLFWGSGRTPAPAPD